MNSLPDEEAYEEGCEEDEEDVEDVEDEEEEGYATEPGQV